MLRQVQWAALGVLAALFITGWRSSTAQEPRHEVTLFSEILAINAPLAESPKGVRRFTLTVQADARGEGPGQLILDPNRPRYNDIGGLIESPRQDDLVLDCSLKLVGARKLLADAPELDQEWFIYEITGEKIMSPLALAASSRHLQFGRLLIKDGRGAVAHAIDLHVEERFYPPCHPGCFPAGTPVETPRGPRPIDRLRPGDLVSAVRPSGETAPVPVQSVFVTDNRLLNVRTDGGDLLTTLTQPLCLAAGGVRPAGKLQAGDALLQWRRGGVRSVTALEVAATGREAQVFNVVLGDSQIFIAGGFLARSKPPAAPAPKHGGLLGRPDL